MRGYALAFTSQIRFYKPSTPPDDGSSIIMIIKTADTIQWQPGIFYSDANENGGPLWMVNEGCNSGDVYESAQIIGWADEDEIAKSACGMAERIAGSGPWS